MSIGICLDRELLILQYGFKAVWLQSVLFYQESTIFIVELMIKCYTVLMSLIKGVK